MKYKVNMMDGKEFIVPEKVYEAIMRAGADRIVWGNLIINLRSISSVSPEREEINYPKLPNKIYNRKTAVNAVESLIKGISKFIKENPESHKAEILLERMQKRKKLAEEGKIKDIKNIIKF